MTDEYRQLKHSAKIVQTNPARTAFDSFASINIRAGADEVFSKLKQLHIPQRTGGHYDITGSNEHTTQSKQIPGQTVVD